MGKSKLPDEVKLDIVNRLKNNESKSAIAKEVGVSVSTVYATANKLKAEERQSKSVPIPVGFKNMKEAFVTAAACHFNGLDSEFTGSLCRSKGINLDELKEFCQLVIEQDSLAIVSYQELSEYKSQISDANAQIRVLSKDKAESEKALAEYAKSQLIKNRETELTVELLKKAIASFSCKD